MFYRNVIRRSDGESPSVYDKGYEVVDQRRIQQEEALPESKDKKGNQPTYRGPVCDLGKIDIEMTTA